MQCEFFRRVHERFKAVSAIGAFQSLWNALIAPLISGAAARDRVTPRMGDTCVRIGSG
jgi:hypothetical protein